jgi:hypothetical protein
MRFRNHRGLVCGVRLDSVASRMMLLVEEAGLQPVVATTGSARVNATAFQ